MRYNVRHTTGGVLATDSWNGHTFEVRCQRFGTRAGAYARLWVRADGQRFEFVEANLLSAANSDFAREHPGSRWLPLVEVPFRISEQGSLVPCRAEFDVSLFPPLGCDKTFRYRVFVNDQQVAASEIAPAADRGMLVFHLMLGAFVVVWLGAMWLFTSRA